MEWPEQWWSLWSTLTIRRKMLNTGATPTHKPQLPMGPPSQTPSPSPKPTGLNCPIVAGPGLGWRTGGGWQQKQQVVADTGSKWRRRKETGNLISSDLQPGLGTHLCPNFVDWVSSKPIKICDSNSYYMKQLLAYGQSVSLFPIITHDLTRILLVTTPQIKIRLIRIGQHETWVKNALWMDKLLKFVKTYNGYSIE